jgi:hypothetical protein
MSRHFKARDKTTQKMTKDGLVERNAATGEDISLSKRQADVDLRAAKPGNRGFSQAGKDISPKATPKRKQVYRHGKANPANDVKPVETPDPNSAHTQPDTTSGKLYHKQFYHHDASDQDSDVKPVETPDPNSVHAQPGVIDGTTLPAHVSHQPDSGYNNLVSRQSGDPMKHSAGESISSGASNASGSKQHALRNHAIRHQADNAHDKGFKGEPVKQNETLKPGKNRLQFASDEKAPEKATGKTARRQASADRKVERAEHAAKRSGEKLSKAQDKLPSKIMPAKGSVAKGLTVSESGRQQSQKLQFEKTDIPQDTHMKGPVISHPVKGVLNFTLASAHRKLSQHEDENVGLKTVNRTGEAAEAGVRSILLYRKKAPYRKARRLGRIAAKKHMRMEYRRAVAKNPKLQRNAVMRAWQKHRIRKGYAKSAHEAHKAAKKAKLAGGAVTRLGKAIAIMAKRHPVITAVVVVIALIVFVLMSLFSVASSMGGSTVTSIFFSTYLADDADMLGAEAVYAGMEADLQYRLDNYEQLNPGYDEYHYELDPIWHDPYVLISILHALHDLEWTLSQVQGTLAMLFDLQYILTETETVEIRTRTETEIETVTLIDPETGESYEEEIEVEVIVEYEYRIMTVTLENFNLSHLPVYIMGTERLGRYALLMRTLGNRPDLFPVGQFPNASYYQEYGKHTIPPEYFGDEVFAAIIAEAEKYLGWPYVWGGSSPQTSFDCSGFVSWVYNQSGWNFGRLTARGLYNICTPIPPEHAKPGDMIFFNYTYNAPQPHLPTHVGIYVGDGMMIHAGKPIGYVSINTPYWQKHFFSFGRP